MQLQSYLAHPNLLINTNAAAVFVIIFNVPVPFSVTTEKLISSALPVDIEVIANSGLKFRDTVQPFFVGFSTFWNRIF
jgi:hypothetical protein